MPRRDILDNPQEMPLGYTTHKGEDGSQYRFWKSEGGWTWRRYIAGRVYWGVLDFTEADTPGGVLDRLIDRAAADDAHDLPVYLKGEPDER